jgi:hypothetical protein
MPDASPPTGFARLSRLQATLVLGLTGGAMLLLVGVSQSPLKSGFADAPDRGPGDVQLYNAEIARMRQGQAYYAAADAELRQRGYPTRRVFNWRTPLPVGLIGALPDKCLGQALLGGAALLLVLCSFGWLCREAGPRAALGAMLLLNGALLPIALDELFVMPELWAGVLVALSIAAYAQDQPRWGLAAGLAALFFRELAAPYCMLCVVLAARRRRGKEVAVWLAGFVVYGLYYAQHVCRVLALIHADDLDHVHGWICFGGAGFVISTAQMNAYLLLLPQWVTALFVPLALLGAASWNTPAGERLGITLAGYLVAFSIVGQDFNQYWGSLIAPLFCLAAARFPAAARDLCRAVRGGSVVYPGTVACSAGACDV